MLAHFTEILPRVQQHVHTTIAVVLLPRSYLGGADPEHQRSRGLPLTLTSAAVLGELLLHVEEDGQVEVVHPLPAMRRVNDSGRSGNQSDPSHHYNTE